MVGAFICQAPDSILAQSWPNWGILVFNDGRTDDTIETLLGTDHTVGFRSTRTLLESPDGEAPNECPCLRIQNTLLKTLFFQNSAIPGSGSEVKACHQPLDLAGLVDEPLRSLKDIDMWMRLAATTSYQGIDDPLMTVVKHPDSMSRNLSAMRASTDQVMKKNRRQAPHHRQDMLWHCGYVAVLADYAKGMYRAGQKVETIRLLFWGALALRGSEGSLSHWAAIGNVGQSTDWKELINDVR